MAQAFGVDSTRPLRFRLDRLWLEIPLRAEAVTLFHMYPNSEVELADGTVRPESVMSTGGALPAQSCAMPFKALLWLGNEERGLGWFAENDRNWQPESAGRAIELISRGEERILRLRLLDSQPEDMPLVTGIMMDSPELYQKLAMDNTALRKNMLDLCGILSDSELDVKTVNFDDNLNITLYIGNIEAELGQAEYLSEKIANLVSLYEKVKNQKGTLNMTAFTGSDEPITFEEETESETEGETDITSLQNYDTYFQVYDSNGVLHNDARVVNGAVVDSAGNAISGCSLNEDGNVVDAYQNVITLNLPTESNQTETSASAGGNDTLGTSSVTGQTSETAAETQASQETTADSSTQQDTAAQNETSDSSTLTAGSGVMAFDSNGTLHYDARIVNGQVVDSSGNVISGCTVTEDGNIKDAYWNIIDPSTGANLNGQ